LSTWPWEPLHWELACTSWRSCSMLIGTFFLFFIFFILTSWRSGSVLIGTCFLVLLLVEVWSSMFHWHSRLPTTKKKTTKRAQRGAQANGRNIYIYIYIYVIYIYILKKWQTKLCGHRGGPGCRKGKRTARERVLYCMILFLWKMCRIILLGKMQYLQKRPTLVSKETYTLVPGSASFIWKTSESRSRQWGAEGKSAPIAAWLKVS